MGARDFSDRAPQIPIEPARPQSVQAPVGVRFQRFRPDRKVAQDDIRVSLFKQRIAYMRSQVRGGEDGGAYSLVRYRPTLI